MASSSYTQILRYGIRGCLEVSENTHRAGATLAHAQDSQGDFLRYPMDIESSTKSCVSSCLKTFLINIRSVRHSLLCQKRCGNHIDSRRVFMRGRCPSQGGSKHRGGLVRPPSWIMNPRHLRSAIVLHEKSIVDLCRLMVISVNEI